MEVTWFCLTRDRALLLRTGSDFNERVGTETFGLKRKPEVLTVAEDRRVD